MPSPPAIDQAIRLARRATLWLVGPIAFALRGPVTELAPPAQCGGALELISMLVVRAWPALHIGPLFTALQAVAVTLAFGFFGALALRTSGSLVVALALTATIAISRPYDAALALPTSAAAFAVCAVTALVRCAWIDKREQWRTVYACGTVVTAASIVPAWTATCAFLTFALASRSRASEATSRRLLVASMASVAAAIVPTLIAAMVNQARSFPRWTSCVLPGSPVNLAAFGDAVDATGPVVLALSALGGYVAVLGVGLSRSAGLAAIALVTIVPGLRDVWPRDVALAPILVAIWCLAGLGLREMLVRLEPRRRTIACGLLVAIVPALQLSRVHAEHDDHRTLLGHKRASLARIQQLLNQVPSGSAIVEEDASVDLLLRAASLGGRQSRRPLVVVPATRASVLGALNTERVFAFPAGQRDLGLRGFVLEPVPANSGGLAAISGARACVGLTREWIDLDAIGAHGRVALVADSPLASGPVVIYFSGMDGYTPGPDNWPQRAMPGFDLQMFDRSSATTAVLMDAEASSVHLNGHAVFAAPHVARLTLSRLPGTPTALPIILGPPRLSGVGRLTAEPTDALPLTVCDAPRISISEF